jgi:two-component system, cell cycle sensor histidine kinase and response regulator CckA
LSSEEDTMEGQVCRKSDSPAVAVNTSGVVLVVENDTSSQMLLTIALRKAGYLVLTAGNAAEAREIAALFPGTIDLLITDLVLPGGSNGVELGRDIQTMRAKTQVLYMSGFTRAAAATCGLTVSGPFIEKPIFLPAFRALVAELVAITAGARG